MVITGFFAQCWKLLSSRYELASLLSDIALHNTTHKQDTLVEYVL